MSAAQRKQAPAKTPPENTKQSGVVASAASDKPAAQLEKYYRIRRINGFLSEIVEIEVDEAVTVPKAVSKQDLREILMVRLEDFICTGSKKKG